MLREGAEALWQQWALQAAATVPAPSVSHQVARTTPRQARLPCIRHDRRVAASPARALFRPVP